MERKRMHGAIGDDARRHDVSDAGGVGGLAESPAGRLLTPRTGVRNPTAAGDGPPGTAGELSCAQRRLWFSHQLTPGSPAYNVTAVWRIEGRVDAEVLARALREVCDRHEVLRTTFTGAQGRPRPVVSPSAVFVLETDDLRGAEDEALRRVRRLAARPFDLTAGPLLRAQLFQVAEDRHRFALHLHHIVADDRSAEVLWRELSALYEAYAAGLPSPLPPPAVQYADHAARQNSWLAGEEAGERLRFWTELLAGAPDSPALPADRPRPRALSGRGRTLDFTVPAATAEALRAIGREHGASPRAVFLTVFQVLLARYTGGGDIVVGCPEPGRSGPGAEELIGFLVNTVALRLTWRGDPAFTELLGRTERLVRDARLHGDVPFDRVVEELAPERDLSRHPVFQILFAYGRESGRPAPSGWSVERSGADLGLARFDLELELTEGPGTTRGTLRYSTDLFEPATVRGLARHFVTLCAGVAAGPRRTVARLPLLDAEERDRILRVWNDRGRPEEYEGHPLDRFEEVVRADPAAVALEYAGEELSYGELDVRANRLARLLAGHGVRPEDVVAICLDRGFAAVTALLAVLKAGAACLPLDPALPAGRLAPVFRDARVRLVLTDAAHAPRLPTGALPVLRHDGSAPVGRPVTPPDVPRDLDALAQIVPAPGPAGPPGGIALTWQALRSVLRFDGHRLRTRGLAARSCAQLASHGFDVSLPEVFVTLLRGGRLVLVGDGARQDPARLLELLSRRRVERVRLSSAQLDRLAVAWSERPSALAVRHVSVSGEALRLAPETVDLLSGLAGVVLENQYGVCETHQATAALLTGDPRTWPAAPPIGRPLPGTRVHLLDGRLNPVPPGVPGELYLAGPSLARGYLHRPGLTAGHFVANPFRPGERMYRTGDLARWSHHGTLTHLGRADRQITVRGRRVEPADIETALTAHPQVSRAAVLLREDRPGDRRLTAYLVPAGRGEEPDPAAVRVHLARYLPDSLVPAALVVVDRLPRDAEGEVDVRALPRPRPAAAARRRPRTMREHLLCELFAEVLGAGAVGVDQDFFALGGDSALAPRLIGRIRSTLGVELPVRRLFDAPTPAGLAAAMAERGAGRPALSGLETLFPLRTAGTGAPLFCVHPAAGISWCYAGLPRLLGPGVPVYGLQDPGLTDPALLPGSVEEMAAGHVEHIRAVRPHGPYHLLGWSFGGLVAQEIAVRLQRQGEEVGLLCVLDGSPGRTETGPGPGAGPGARGVGLRRSAGVPVEFDERELAAVHRSSVNNALLASRFEPGLFRGDLCFVTAAREPERSGPGWRGWLPYVSGTVRNTPVECVRLGMTRPEALAAVAPTVLEAVRGRAG
ncbi:amino acid adenylation domain-containing protein [Streptomyces amakusaensis]|uniref:Amino acid adenylation domain-containing protein n=1 Tax=Streptomyces amakusaensis TaxID=67271 RepID=A0ABW0AF91_9ACTN